MKQVLQEHPYMKWTQMYYSQIAYQVCHYQIIVYIRNKPSYYFCIPIGMNDPGSSVAPSFPNLSVTGCVQSQIHSRDHLPATAPPSRNLIHPVQPPQQEYLTEQNSVSTYTDT